ncbi:MAG: hypothetical protein PHR36_01535 [Patescibacteria group bacterium]|nr:hypothetical protein [Patescibacteria group bacterium]
MAKKFAVLAACFLAAMLFSDLTFGQDAISSGLSSESVLDTVKVDVWLGFDQKGKIVPEIILHIEGSQSEDSYVLAFPSANWKESPMVAIVFLLVHENEFNFNEVKKKVPYYDPIRFPVCCVIKANDNIAEVIPMGFTFPGKYNVARVKGEITYFHCELVLTKEAAWAAKDL